MATESLPLAKGDYARKVAKTPLVPMKNRFIEGAPVLNSTGINAIARPSLKKLLEVGTGPVRSLFSAPSLFNDDLFVVSGVSLYVVTPDLNVTNLGPLSNNPIGDVSWAPVANIEDVPARLFFTEGGVLWMYTRNAEATGRLECSGTFSDGDVVEIGGVYYRMTSVGSVDAGSPAGTAANPWRVNSNFPSLVDQLANLLKAINDEGVPGTDYSTALVGHPDVSAYAQTATELFVAAKLYGVGGNSITTTETGANSAWAAATLTGGGGEKLRQVRVPQDAGAAHVASINSYVIVVPAQTESLGTIGKFYWIEPGETTIDPLNFANAERSSDEIHQVGVFSNLFWLFGAATTEPWLVSGDVDAPMQRYMSILFDRGSWEGTAVQVKDSLIVVDQHGGVFQIQGGQYRISRPDIEERIRRAMQIQQYQSGV